MRTEKGESQGPGAPGGWALHRRGGREVHADTTTEVQEKIEILETTITDVGTEGLRARVAQEREG